MFYNLTKSDERKSHEAYVRDKFCVSEYSDSRKKEAAELVAARTRETLKELSKEESRKSFVM